MKVVRKILVGLAVVLALYGLVVALSTHRGSYSVTNGAGEPIARVAVTVCKQTKEFRDIQPGHSRAGCYTIRGDSDVTIEVVFASGRTLQKQTGYVTSGLDFQHEILVRESDIELVLIQQEYRSQ